MNFTIVIQGKTNKECLKKNIENTCGIPVVVSTWRGDEAPERENVIKSMMPTNFGMHNYMLQLVSTIKGMKKVRTKYAIKVRGDEFYNYTKLVEAVEANKDMVFVAPVFFRKMSYCRHPYHISDHLMAGRTDHLLDMFKAAKVKYESTMSENDCKEWGLTVAHMRNMGFEKFEDLNAGKEEMKKSFGIVKMKDLKPYRVTANCYRKVFYDNFVPNEWNSIESMDDL